MEIREEIAKAMSKHGVINDFLYQELLDLFNQWLEEQGAVQELLNEGWAQKREDKWIYMPLRIK